jgi:electron transfer flavoprotein beta subunit
MGADEGILIPYPEKYDYHVVSTILAEAIRKIGEYDIIICGEASVDLFSGQVGPKIAGLLKIPQITYALSIDASKDKMVAERNMGDKLVTSESTYPVLVTVTKEINEPRLPSLMQILGAANKPISEWSVNTLIDKITPLVETLELKGVSMERKNIIYKDNIDESVQQLVNGLAKEGVLG